MPKLPALMDEAETDVLAYMGFRAQHRTKTHSSNTIERLNHEIKGWLLLDGIDRDEMHRCPGYGPQIASASAVSVLPRLMYGLM